MTDQRQRATAENAPSAFFLLQAQYIVFCTTETCYLLLFSVFYSIICTRDFNRRTKNKRYLKNGLCRDSAQDKPGNGPKNKE